jgi:very-short-patch-repair endonuclease
VEWYEHPEDKVAPGYRGRLDGIVVAVAQGENDHRWLPPLPAGAGGWPPLDTDEARLLVALAARHGSPILRSPAQACPDPAGLSRPQRFAELVARLQVAEEAGRARGPAPVAALARQLARAGADRLGEVEDLLAQAQQALQSAGLSADPDTWAEGQWTTRALLDGIAAQWQPSWDSIRMASKRARQTLQDITDGSFPDVEVPQLSESQEKELLAAGRELEQYLASHPMPGRRWPRPAVVKRARLLLEECRVEGVKPAGPQHVATVVRHLGIRAHARTLRERWQGVGSPPQAPAGEQTVSELLDRAAVLEAVDAAVHAIRQVHQALLALGAPMPVTTLDQWRSVRDAAVQARRLLQWQAAEDEFRQVLDELPQSTIGSAPEVQRLWDSAAARDVDGYQAALDALEQAYQREADRREAGKLFQRLSQGHRDLADVFAADPADATWPQRFASLPQAWAWRQAQTFLDTHLQPGREERLASDLARVEARLESVVKELVCDQAAERCLARMTTRHKQALATYAQATANAGQATTAYGRRHLNHARSAMKEAQGAVPAWIMPLRQVAETIAPEPDSFDVVIVDEASQVGLDGLLLLWLAPRIIVVGDDRQCAPFYNGSKHERITQIFDERLTELIPWQREGFDPKSNLYELLSSRFSDVVRLAEHFRCMPEIIKWSSTQFYPDNELVPLRQHGADRLPPLRTVHVSQGHCQGRRDRLTNRPEAEALVEQLHQLIQDPVYAKRSIGVIVLRHGAQTRLIQDLIDVRIDNAFSERHNIKVGTPEQFQGDQRDVILLSLVIDGENTRAVTGRGDQRRFNVAASRARDQMWLFHSVTADQLSSKDLRHSLLTYMINPPVPYPHSPALDSVSADRPQAPFQSLFEQRVFLAIKQRGYHVVPQWEISGKFIDLVVVGNHGRLAVECDGSPYHSTLQQVHHDAERERELRRAGWKFWRVRSSAFALSPEQALAPLWEKLKGMGIQPLAEAAPHPSPQAAAPWMPVALSDNDSEETEEDDFSDDDVDDSADGPADAFREAADRTGAPGIDQQSSSPDDHWPDDEDQDI